MNRFQKYREIMESRNPTDEPNAVNNRAALNAKNDPFKMYGPDGFKPSSTAADRMTPDMQQSMLNKFLSSRAVELATDYDARQLALTGAGMTPVIGAGADFAAAIDSLVNLKLGDLAMNVGAMVPAAGQAVGGVKLAAAAAPAIVKGQKALPGMGDVAKEADMAAAAARRKAKVERAVKDLDAEDLKNVDLPGQQKFFTPDEAAEMAAIEGKFASEIAQGNVPVSRQALARGKEGGDPLGRLLRDIEQAPSQPGLRMDPKPARARVETGTTTRTTPARKVEVDVAPGRMTARQKAAAAAAAAAAATGTTILLRPAPAPITRTDTDTNTAPKDQGKPVQPVRPVQPTNPNQPQQDRPVPQELVPPIDDPEFKRSRQSMGRLVSPRGFREEFSYGVAKTIMEQSGTTAKVLDRIKAAFPKGETGKSIMSAIAATLGLSALGGFGQSGSGRSVGDAISDVGVGGAQLLAGTQGLEILKSLGGYNPRFSPTAAGVDAVMSR